VEIIGIAYKSCFKVEVLRLLRTSLFDYVTDRY